MDILPQVDDDEPVIVIVSEKSQCEGIRPQHSAVHPIHPLLGKHVVLPAEFQ